MSLQEIGTIRERLWLLAHDEQRDLEPRLHPRTLEIGLMAATLVDLLLADRIGITTADGLVYQAPPTRGRPVPAKLDSVTEGVMQAVAEQSTRLPEMLRAATADLPAEHHPFVRLYQRTHAALITAGIIVEQRRTFRASRYQLADPAGLAWNKQHVTRRLVYHDGYGVVAVDSLCALIGALNLHTQLVTPYEPAEAGRILHEITQRLPERVGPNSPLTVIPYLAHRVRNAVGDLATAAF